MASYGRYHQSSAVCFYENPSCDHNTELNPSQYNKLTRPSTTTKRTLPHQAPLLPQPHQAPSSLNHTKLTPSPPNPAQSSSTPPASLPLHPALAIKMTTSTMDTIRAMNETDRRTQASLICILGVINNPPCMQCLMHEDDPDFMLFNCTSIPPTHPEYAQHGWGGACCNCLRAGEADLCCYTTVTNTSIGTSGLNSLEQWDGTAGGAGNSPAGAALMPSIGEMLVSGESDSTIPSHITGPPPTGNRTQGLGAARRPTRRHTTRRRPPARNPPQGNVGAAQGPVQNTQGAGAVGGGSC